MALTRNTNQRNTSWNAPYTFSGKEKDAETGYGYFGARYYDSGLSIWLSVDPMSDKYPSMSPYNYCANNPVILVDPDGREFGDYLNLNGVKIGSDGNNDNKEYIVADHDDREKIIANEAQGKTTPEVCSALELPSMNTREDMFNHVSTGDQNNPNAENGGLVGLCGAPGLPYSQWTEGIRLGQQGPTGDPCVDEELSFNPNTANSRFLKVTGTFHSHSSGTNVCSDGTVRVWSQQLSTPDRLNAVKNEFKFGAVGTNFLFNMSDRSVILYDSRGNEAKITFDVFLNR